MSNLSTAEITFAEDNHWNRSEHLPPTNTRLRIKLNDGQIVDGIRNTHVKNRKGNLGYYMDSFGKLDLIPEGEIQGWQYV
tara:strand:- start:12797 stop:13036 length:240 start_codon:yes stop_codon:yes gene_type:complete